MKYEEIRTTVLEAIMDAVDQGLIHGTSGNIAMRDKNDPVIAITPSSIPYKGMKPEHIAIVDYDGNWIDGPYKPSSEVPMHTAVYRARPDVMATVHTHSMFATIMAMGENPRLEPITPPHCEFSPVGVVPFAMPGTEDLANHIVAALGSDSNGALMKNHGMFTCGRSMQEAMFATAYIEELAQMTYYARLIGVCEPMPEEHVAVLKEMLANNMAV